MNTNKKKILAIVPSRSQGNGREKNVDRFIDAWNEKTEGLSDIVIALDPDDEHYYTRRKEAIYFVNSTRQRMIPTLNKCATSDFAKEYEMLAFFGDDHLIQTNWETEMYKANKDCGGYGIFYGNDLLQGEKLPTAVCLDNRIVTSLGYFAPPMLTHLFADNFWIDLGKELGTLRYFPNIIFEHIHPHIQKTEMDSMYLESNSFFQEDQNLYEEFCSNGEFQKAVKMIEVDRLQQV